MGYHGIHLANVDQRFAQGLLDARHGERLDERMFLVDEDLLQLRQVEGAYHRVQTAIELDDVTVETDAPGLHLRRFHHVAQLGLVVLDGLVHLLHLHVVLHHVEVHLALLCHIVGRYGDIHQLTVLVVDGVDADLQIHVHIPFRDDAQRTGPVVFRVLMVQHLVEG